MNKLFMKTAARDAKITKLKKRGSHLLISILRFAFLFGVCFVIIYPLLSIICGSFMSLDDLVDITVKYFPKHFTLANYKNAMEVLEFPETLITTLVVFTITSLLQTFFCTMVGYGFARFHFKLKRVLFACVIIQMLIPPDTLMLTRYIQFRYFSGFGILSLFNLGTVNLVSSDLPLYILGVTCTGLKNGLFIFMLRQYFRGQPKSLEEAAYVDGCSPFRAFFTIMLPGAKTMMTTIFLFSFVWLWTDMTVAPTLTNSKILVNMTYMLKATQDSTGGLNLSLLKNAGIVLIILPVVLVYLVCQRAFVQGIEDSGITGI